MRTIALDFETFYIENTPTNPGYSVSSMGNWRYTHDERFDPYLISVYDGEDSWVGHPKDFNWEAVEGARLLSHNAAFDSQVQAAMVDYGMAPKINPAEWLCTANFTSFLCNRRSLAAASEFLLKQKMEKGMRSWMNKRHWEDAVREGKAEELKKYALYDVIRCHEIFDKFGHKWTPLERGLSDLTIRQCRQGVGIDVEKLKRYKIALQMAIHHIEKSLPWVSEGAKVGSPKAIAEQCRLVGIPRPPVKSREGEEAFLKWEETFAPRYSWVMGVSQHRSLSKVLSTLETIEERLRPDNTIDFSLLYFGAHTGRWSGGGSGLNMQNLRKDPIYILDDYTVLPDGGSLAAYLAQKGIDSKTLLANCREKIDVRSLFIPRPGNKFVPCDLSQIEPRVLNWLCGNFELLERLRTGMSIYEAHARDTMGWTGGDLKKENPMLYKTAKARVLGLGYGCGKAKFKVVAKMLADLDITEEESVTTVESFREQNPKITALWRTLDNRFKASIGKTFEMELPSGRTMSYPVVAQEYRRYQDEETGKWLTKVVVTADIGGKRKPLYGGLLTENLVQATSRDVFGEHLLALDRAGIHTVFTVHDEAVTEVPLDTDKREIERIMSQTPEWLEGCPIAAEAVEASHYLK